MKLYAYLDGDSSTLLAILDESNWEEFHKRFPDEDFYIQEIEVGTVKNIPFIDIDVSSENLYHLRFSNKYILTKCECEKIEDNVFHFGTRRKVIIDSNGCPYIRLHAPDENTARFEAVKIMVKYLEESKKKI